MRAILINPYERTIRAIDHDGTLEGMHRTIKCKTVCKISLTKLDDLWLNDDGLLTAGLPVFRMGVYPHPLAGIGLILAYDAEGNSDATYIPLGKVVCAVRWTDQETTGRLEPTTEETLPNGGFVIRTGKGILRPRGREPTP